MSGVGFQTSAKVSGKDDHAKGVITNALKKSFSPEFLNRIDDVIVFNSLEKEHIQQILELSLQELIERIKQIGFNIKLNEDAKNYIAEKGFDSDFGARPLNRAIQKYLEDAIAEEILKGELTEGDVITADYIDDATELTLSVTKKEKAE